MAFFYETDASATFSTATTDINGHTTATTTETVATEHHAAEPMDKELHTEALIGDLALILIFGAISTVIFKKLKQPLVLGYIVAGFLVGPHFLYVPSVTNETNIDFWAEIGIIILLFSLGLEFNFKKLFNVGGSAIVTSATSVVGMLIIGIGLGKLMDFTLINSLFLGAMLSMSSTTIIIKALNDLNMKRRRFAPLVFGILICEDLFAIIMMVILSSIAINNTLQGSELIFSVTKLLFFLIIWFVVGVFVIPTFFRRYRKAINDEILLILAMGLCFMMTMFSVYSGFSMALGAFVMGSILAGTCEAEHIDKLVKPVKDLFGAVFFISVGMMVDPQIIVEFIGPILLLSVVVIVGKIVFGTFGMLITGQPLKIALESGFSLTQIGEFAFIIASLGMSLGVLDDTIYPIVVAVSVITTFFTPYFIKFAEPAYFWVEKHLPQRLHFLITRYSKQAVEEEDETKKIWHQIVTMYTWRIILYSSLLIAIVLLSQAYVYPLMINMWGTTGNFVATALTLAVMAPFVIALAYPNVTRKQRAKIEAKGNKLANVPLVVMAVFRLLIALGFIYWLISSAYSFTIGLTFSLAVFIVIFIFLSKRLKKQMRSLENKFVKNLNERELRKSGKANNLVSDLHVAYLTVGVDCPFVGERLGNSNIRQEYGVNVVNIQRGSHNIPVPNSNTRIFPGDLLGVIGTDEQIERMIPIIENGLEHDDGEEDQREVKFTHFEVAPDSPIIGQTSRSIHLRDRYSALLVAIQRGDSKYLKPTGKEIFESGDILWVVGDIEKIEELKSLKSLPEDLLTDTQLDY